LTQNRPIRGNFGKANFLAVRSDAGFVHFRQEAPWLGELMAGLLGFPGANQQAEALDRGVGIGQGEDRWGFSPISTTWAMVDVEVGNVS
jgi:hypothetical protein